MNAETIYRALLMLYPKDFRNKYGHEMLLNFRKELRNFKGQGQAFAFLGFWLTHITDLLKTVLEQRFLAGREVHMTPDRWLRIARVCCYLGGSLLLIWAVVLWKTLESQEFFLWAWINSLEEIVRLDPLLIALLGLLVLTNSMCVVALTIWARLVGIRFAWLPMLLALLGIVVSFLGQSRVFGTVVEPPSDAWMVFWFGLQLGFLAWLVFAWIARGHVGTQRWILMPLMIGVLATVGFSVLPVLRISNLEIPPPPSTHCVTASFPGRFSTEDNRMFSMPLGKLFRCIDDAERQSSIWAKRVMDQKRSELVGFQCLILAAFAWIWFGYRLPKPDDQPASASNAHSNQAPAQS